MKTFKNCLICTRQFSTYIDSKFCSSKCYGLSQQGKTHPWRVLDKYGYSAIHKWLRAVYGKPIQCEMNNCPHIAKRIEWALKKGFRYERKRENFFMLCASCHRKYDWTPQQTKKLSGAMKNRIFTPEIRRNMSLGQRGRIIPHEVRKKMSNSQKKRWALRKNLNKNRKNT